MLLRGLTAWLRKHEGENMRARGISGALNELQSQYHLLNEKMTRLQKQYLSETDYARKYNLEWQIKKIDEEQKNVAYEIETITGRLGTSKTPKSGAQESLEPSYDAFFCYHPAERELVRKIASELEIDEHLKILLYEAGEKVEDLYLVNSVAVMVGEMEPWRDKRISQVLAQFTNRRIPMFNVILGNRKHDPYFPLFLKGNRFVDFRKSDPDPYKELELLIKQTSA
jgi:hypothetical protein